MPKVAARQPASTTKARAKDLDDKPKAKTPAKPAETKAKGWAPKDNTVSARSGDSESGGGGGGGGGSTRTVSSGGGGGEAGNAGVSVRQPSRPESKTTYSAGGGGE